MFPGSPFFAWHGLNIFGKKEVNFKVLQFWKSKNWVNKDACVKIFLMYLLIFGAFLPFSLELHMFDDALKHDWDLYYLWFKCVDKCICVHA